MKSLQEIYAPTGKCFGCGPANDKGLRIRSFVDGNELIARWRPEPHHQAIGNILNGGICGALLDCHAAWAASYHLMLQNSASELPFTVTAEYQVVFAKPTPLDQELLLRARVVSSTQRKAVVEARIEIGEVITATCRGTFVTPRQGHPAPHR